MNSRLISEQSLNLPLYFLCAGIVAITVLAAGLTYWLLERNQNKWTHEYGQALANLSAHRALDSTLNHDLVSLQVILSDVAENTSVINATIHDVENNLLVQAGRRGEAGGNNNYTNFSAPITLHNSIAGYVTITLNLDGENPFPGQLLWLFGLLAATLIAITLCYAYFSRAKLLAEQPTRSSIPILKSPGKTSQENDGDSKDSVDGHFQAQLMLCLQNYQELSQQLNSKAFRGLNQRLEQQLIGIMALYGGKLLQAGHDIIHVRFSSQDSGNDAVFNGLCAALLLLKMNQQPASIQLQLSALLQEAGDHHNLLKRLPYFMAEQQDYDRLLHDAAENTLLVQAQLLEDTSLAERFNCRPTTEADELMQVQGLQPAYESLLDKQMHQMSVNSIEDAQHKVDNR